MEFDFALWLGVTVFLSVVAIFWVKKHEKLEAEAIASGDLVVIKANPKKAWPVWLLNSLLLMPLIAFIVWTDKKLMDCSQLFNINIIYIQLNLLVFFMPLLLTGVFIYQWRVAKKSLKNGFFPPTNDVYLFDTKALSIRLKRVKVRVYSLLYLLPIFTLIFYGVSFVMYQKLQLGRSYIVIEKQLEQKCLVIKHYP